MYIRPSGLWEEDCIALVYNPELTDDCLLSANEAVTKALQNYYNKEQITNQVNFIPIVCVDRITPTFRKFLSRPIPKDFKSLQLPVGISFGGKKIYVTNQTSCFAILKYKRLRKEFLNIMHLEVPQNQEK